HHRRWTPGPRMILVEPCGPGRGFWRSTTTVTLDLVEGAGPGAGPVAGRADGAEPTGWAGAGPGQVVVGGSACCRAQWYIGPAAAASAYMELVVPDSLICVIWPVASVPAGPMPD